MKIKDIDMQGKLSYAQDLLDDIEEFETMKTKPVNPYDQELEMIERYMEDIGMFLQVWV